MVGYSICDTTIMSGSRINKPHDVGLVPKQITKGIRVGM